MDGLESLWREMKDFVSIVVNMTWSLSRQPGQSNSPNTDAKEQIEKADVEEDFEEEEPLLLK